jgi:hypothetical protein
MLRWVFIAVIFFHGLIHLMGFAKAFGFGTFEQLTKPITRPVGLLWLLAAVLVLAAVVLFLFKQSAWWMAGLAAVALSQLLIITAWRDARFGSIANLILLLPALVAFGSWNFERHYQATVSKVLEVATSAPVVTEESLAPLPEPVQRWLRTSGVVGASPTQHVRVMQTGKMLTKPGGNWMPFTAEQYFTSHPPAFVWRTKVDVAPLTFLLGQDEYRSGKGSMKIRLFGLVSVVDSRGPEIDQGTLLRYLGEMVWNPPAALSPQIHWKEIDHATAEATFTFGDVTATGTFTFNAAGDVTGFEAMRYGEFDGVSRLERWHIECADHRSMDGVRVPTRCAVSWKLKAGDFRWLELSIDSLAHKNLPQ